MITDILTCLHESSYMLCRDIASAIRLLLDSVNNVFPYITGSQARQVSTILTALPVQCVANVL